MTYLPPVKTPITEYPTIVSLFETSRKLTENANMMYAHIIMDVGAAIKACHVAWNDENYWNYVIVHSGDLQAMVTFFGVIGTFISGSGFEEIACQSGLCMSGSINTLLLGRHYNRCWYVQKINDALERLFIRQYLPLAPVSLSLKINYDGTIRKTVMSKLFDATIHDLTVTKQENLPSAEERSTSFLDLATKMRLHVKNYDSI